VKDNWYNQFRILYLLHSSRFDNCVDAMSTNELLGTEELRHILRDRGLTATILGDIEYLADAGLINLQGDVRTGILKIKSRGTEALNTIFEAYEQYLRQQSEPDLQHQYQHISRLPDNIKRFEIYRYSKEGYGANFKSFLERTRIFERFYQVRPIEQVIPNDLSKWTEDVIGLSNQPIERRIKEREKDLMERKSSFKYDRVMQGPNKKVEKETSIAIFGFMNGHGGILFIGVDPAGKTVGLSKDYSLVQNNNSDGFERELRNSVEKYLKDKLADVLVEVKFHPSDGEEICEVVVKPSSRPVVLYDGDIQEFYVRVGNSTKLYSASATIEYCRMRFKSN
jgi:predicted HTH transcriptional regulator